MPGCGSTSVPTPMRRRIARRGRARFRRNAPRSGKAAEPDVARSPRKHVPRITEGLMDSKTAGLRAAERLTALLLPQPQRFDQLIGALHFLGQKFRHLLRRAGVDERAVLGQPPLEFRV